ncbi:MAG: hypothetical protein ACYSWY_10480, partial [Planctomycetota bacterium]
MMTKKTSKPMIKELELGRCVPRTTFFMSLEYLCLCIADSYSSFVGLVKLPEEHVDLTFPH